MVLMDQITAISPALHSSGCEEGGGVPASGSRRSVSEGRRRSERSLRVHMETLKATHRQQMESLELQHQADLEKRLLQNSLLSTSTDWMLKTSILHENPRHHDRQETDNYRHHRSKVVPRNVLSDRIKTSSSVTGHLGLERERQRKPLPQDTQKAKEEADLTECQKQFRVPPVPEHVSKCLYDELVHEQERLRKEGHQQRKDFLLAMQKPFRFQKKDEKRRERLKEEEVSANQDDKTEPVCVRKPIPTIPKSVSEPRFSEQLKEQEQQRKIRIQLRAQETLKASSAPIQRHKCSEDLQPRSAQRTKTRMLGYLDQKPLFRPKTNSTVPDFEKLYQAFQQKSLERAEQRDVTHCKPFQLRTSTLQTRHRSPESTRKSTNTQSLKRSSSFGGLSSLSMDTLPTYITDAARRRSMAIRRSLELKDLKEQQNAEWMKRHRMKSQAMSRTVSTRAKAMDPHKSLKDVYQEKLKQHRQADLDRVRDYQRELKEMRGRVTARPFLFEQVSQKNAKCNAERRYRNTLEQAGLDENFVRSKGETNETIHGSNDEEESSTESEAQQSSGTDEDSVPEEEKQGSVETKEEEFC